MTVFRVSCDVEDKLQESYMQSICPAHRAISEAFSEILTREPPTSLFVTEVALSLRSLIILRLSVSTL